jgi:hypothetical protein
MDAANEGHDAIQKKMGFAAVARLNAGHSFLQARKPRRYAMPSINPLLWCNREAEGAA